MAISTHVLDTAKGRPAAGISVSLLQHTDDTLSDHYQVRDNDSALWLFGNGEITTTPIRFSLSLVASTEFAAVSERVAFIASVIH